MSLREMKDQMHDLLWNAQQSWFQLRAAGWTKHALKMAGIRSSGDPNALTRGIIFAGRTRVTYEHILKAFLEYAHQTFGVDQLDRIDTEHARAYLDACIQKGWAAKTLNTLRSALAKLASLTGRTQSGAALSRQYGERIRQLVRDGRIAGLTRATPSPEVIERAIGVLGAWDVRQFSRTGQPRAYALAARLQLETAARSVSVTERVTKDSLKDGDRIELIAKGGKLQSFQIPRELHAALQAHLSGAPGPVAELHRYRMSLERAVKAAGGRVTGTHGLRRVSTRCFYAREYQRRLSAGDSPGRAREEARAEAVARLGHSRTRKDQAVCFYVDICPAQSQAVEGGADEQSSIRSRWFASDHFIAPPEADQTT